MNLTSEDFASLSVCDYADFLPRNQFINPEIRPLWHPIPRIAGRAFTVFCDPGDHLMVHAAIYRAEPGDVLVIKADKNYAVAGGNVCAIAQQRGIAGMIVDGMIRDIAEVRAAKFPVYARGVIPKPGAKRQISDLNQPIDCGGVIVHRHDMIVADEEGVAVIPKAQLEEAYKSAAARAEKDASLSLTQWRSQHQQNVERVLTTLGYQGK
ncbi:RraA family protein [Alteromonas sediminis]|uniref:Putative 4-hydroxy-4-methyl-2-oxoglutarate aldolase n=1 Tax=Alteromonas sediminis TaxID=2259342 RepID=A0A3N5XX92_9ALTE|nr:RraA family protein [Alteromonas sediminis]RPJ65130.1 RraA family protein [Alteromonas sediminis]